MRTEADWLAMSDGLLAMTRELHELAVEGAWEHLELLQNQRQGLLDLLLDRPVPPALVEAITQRVTQIIEIDQELRRLAYERHQQLQQEVGEMQRGKLAIATYQAIGE